jgi:hypothetical protein
MSTEEVKQAILKELSDDYVGLWSIIRYVKKSELCNNLLEIQQLSLKIILDLLDDKLMQAGDFLPDGRFEIWHMPSNEIIEIIEKTWNELGREPNIGDIVWFT